MTVSFEILDNTASPCFEERLHGRALRRGKVMSREYSNDEKLLTKGEVARLCRVDVRTVDRWLTAGRLSCHRTPSGRALFRKQDVLTLFSLERRRPLLRVFTNASTISFDCEV